MQSSKFQTLADIRRIFVRHWVDTDCLRVGLHQGVVRVGGDLRSSCNQRDTPIGAAFFESLETELCRLRDVRRVHFELQNWKRDSSGQWLCTDEDHRSRRIHRAPRSHPIRLVFDERRPGETPDDARR